MGAGGDSLVDYRLPVGRQPGQEHRRLDLGAGHRGLVVDAVQRSAGDGDRGEAVVACAFDPGPHPDQWLGHPVHGPGAE